MVSVSPRDASIGARAPQQSAQPQAEKPAQVQEPAVAEESREDKELARIQAEIRGVIHPDPQALGNALGIDLDAANAEADDSRASSLEDLGDLDHCGTPEFALKFYPAVDPGGAGEVGTDQLPNWQLILLAWDGSQWHASRIGVGFEPYKLQVLSSLVPGSRQIAVVVYAGARAIPYPSIYKVKDHAADLLWDGRSDESLYEGFDQGRIEFRESDEGATPFMIASGRADPGLLRFPRESPRGFDAQTIYNWDGHAFIPKQTQYQENGDYRIYQFISALHLHNYVAAYALVDPSKFLKADKPSLKMFRKTLEESWPEFLDDQIFGVPDQSASVSGALSFELNTDEKHNLYIPSFGQSPKLLITGMERRELPHKTDQDSN